MRILGRLSREHAIRPHQSSHGRRHGSRHVCGIVLAALFVHVFRHDRRGKADFNVRGDFSLRTRKASPETPSKETVPLPKVAGVIELRPTTSGAAYTGLKSGFRRTHSPSTHAPPRADSSPISLRPQFVNAAPKVAGRSKEANAQSKGEESSTPAKKSSTHVPSPRPSCIFSPSASASKGFLMASSRNVPPDSNPPNPSPEACPAGQIVAYCKAWAMARNLEALP